MNLEEFGTAAKDVPMSTENESFDDFLSHYKKKIKDHSSIFEHSYVQRILSESQVNWSDFSQGKYLEFSVNETQHLSQMSSLSAHITVQLLEIMPDGSFQELKEDDSARVGLIPGG